MVTVSHAIPYGFNADGRACGIEFVRAWRDNANISIFSPLYTAVAPLSR